MQMRSEFLDSSAMYLIRVIGALDARWLETFDDISIVVNALQGIKSISTICVHTADQARLFGILNALYDYQIPVVYLERMSFPDNSPSLLLGA